MVVLVVVVGVEEEELVRLNDVGLFFVLSGLPGVEVEEDGWMRRAKNEGKRGDEGGEDEGEADEEEVAILLMFYVVGGCEQMERQDV